MTTVTARDMTRTDSGHEVFSDVQWDELRDSLGLSNREYQIVRAVFDGTPEAAIANDLGISAHTVHTYLERLYRKLAVSSRCALLIRVFREFLQLRGVPRTVG